MEIWGNTYKTNLQPIFLLKKKAIRVISYAEYHAPRYQLFIRLNILKLHDLVDLNTAVIMYKIHNLMLPYCLQETFQTIESRYNLRGTDLLQKPKARSNTNRRCLSVKGVDLWNGLPNPLKCSKTIHAFFLNAIRKRTCSTCLSCLNDD